MATIVHSVVNDAAANPDVEVDSTAWNAAHVLTGKIGLANGGTNVDLSATGGSGQVLKQTGGGADITVGTVAASEIASGAALTRTDDTNVTLTLGGTPTTALLAATSITAGWAGTLSPARGGTGVANNAASTLTISGSFGATFTLSGTTALTLPTTGTLATLAGTEELDNKTLDSSVAKGTWTASGTWTIPAVTLGGTVSGGGNQINNVIIGTSTPLAGSFTTVSGSTSVTSPIVKSDAGLDFQTNGTTFAYNITTGQQHFFGTTKNTPPTGPIVTVSKNASALPAIGTPAGVTGTAQAVMTLGGLDDTAAEVFIQSFGTARASSIRYFHANGTAAARTASTGAGNTLAANFAYSYTGSVYVPSSGFIFSNTEATVSGTVSGGRIDLYATPTGTTGVAIGASIGAGFMVGNTTDRGAGTINMTGGLFLGSFTVATLPAGTAAGNSAFASNARVFNGTGTQEGAGVGTGGMVNYNGTAWKLTGTNTTAIA